MAIFIALLAGGCRRECDCPVDCVPPAIGPAAIAAPAVDPGGSITPAGSGETAAAVPAPAEGYCASESGEVFHRCSCSSVKRVKPEKLVRLPTRADALASGRRPCKHCKP